MRNEEWSAVLDGRTVLYTYRDMTETMVCITAQVQGNPVVYTKNVPSPMTRADVEAEFAGDVTTP